jgi:hypothetical protein
MPGRPEPKDRAPLGVTEREAQLVTYGLELLLSNTDRDPELTEPVMDLIERFQHAPRERRALVGTPSAPS